MYSPRSSEGAEQILAMRDCYVDMVASSGKAARGATLFRLNTFELDRQTYKLSQELLLSQITASRLDHQYLTELVYRPLEASVTLALEELKVENARLKANRDRFAVGEIHRSELAMAEAAVAKREINFRRCEIELSQSFPLWS